MAPLLHVAREKGMRVEVFFLHRWVAEAAQGVAALASLENSGVVFRRPFDDSSGRLARACRLFMSAVFEGLGSIRHSRAAWLRGLRVAFSEIAGREAGHPNRLAHCPQYTKINLDLEAFDQVDVLLVDASFIKDAIWKNPVFRQLIQRQSPAVLLIGFHGVVTERLAGLKPGRRRDLGPLDIPDSTRIVLCLASEKGYIDFRLGGEPLESAVIGPIHHAAWWRKVVYGGELKRGISSQQGMPRRIALFLKSNLNMGKDYYEAAVSQWIDTVRDCGFEPVLKPHPRDNLEELTENYGERAIITSSEEEVLTTCEALISFPSTVLMELAHAGLPIAAWLPSEQCRSGQRRDFLIGVCEEADTQVISSEGDLVGFLGMLDQGSDEQRGDAHGEDGSKRDELEAFLADIEKSCGSSVGHLSQGAIAVNKDCR